MSSSKRLIINADDFGISRSVNLGIVEAAQAGAVTSASMMVNLPDFADAVDRSTSCPKLSLGLHLNLTVGRPLTNARSLTRGTGEFYPLPSLLARASVGLVDASDIATECLAQIDRMLDAGIEPTHLDSHRHVHAHPAFTRAVVEAAASRGIFEIRVPRESFTTNALDLGASVKKLALRVGTAVSRQRTGRKGTHHFAGVSLQGGKFFAKRLFHLISSLPPGTTELMTHPGYADASLAARDSYTLERVTELRVLCSGEFRDLLERSGVTLTRFGKSGTIAAADGELAQHH